MIISCNSGTEKVNYFEFEGAWHKDSVLVFQFDEKAQGHGIYFETRNDNQYPFANLYLLTELHTPNGLVVADTLEYYLSKPDGSWLGKGSGSIKKMRLVYRDSLILPDSGSYTLHIRHGMREDSLRGLHEFGVLLK